MANSDDVVPVLTAPPGWKKTCVMKTKKNGTPGKAIVTFTSEKTGDAFTSRHKLEKYLKANPSPDSPSISDFYWGKDDTPRRSTRHGDGPPFKKARTSPASKEKEASKETKSAEEADKSLEEDFETAVGDEKEKQDEIKDPQDAVMQEKPVEEGKNQDMELDSAKEDTEEPQVEADETSGKDNEKPVDYKTQDVPPEDGDKNEMEVDKGTDGTLEPQIEVTDADLTSGKAGNETPIDDKTQVAPPEDGDKNDKGKDDILEPQVDTEAADQVSGKEVKVAATVEEGKQVAHGEIPNGNHGNVDEPKL